jgi:exosome complex component RRP42
MVADIVSFIKRDYIHAMAEKGVRLDGRGLEDVREVRVTKPFVDSAEGSARVQLGKTDVIVGVKIEPGSPFADRPELGVLISTAELPPSQTIDLAPLCIKAGEKVWMVFIDIHPVDYSGNLFDACQYSAMAALSTAVVPWSKVDEKRKDEPLELRHTPLSLTVVKLGSKILVDPSLDEEEVADARLTVVCDENGDLRAMQKGLPGAFTIDEVKYVVELSQKLGAKLRPVLTK